MPKTRLLLPAAVVLGSLAPSVEAGAMDAWATAAPRACAARADVVRKLADRFGETRTGIGLHKDDAVVEVFSSGATGTWTIVVTGADGMSCLLAAGRGWEQLPAGSVRPGHGA